MWDWDIVHLSWVWVDLGFERWRTIMALHCSRDSIKRFPSPPSFSSLCSKRLLCLVCKYDSNF